MVLAGRTLLVAGPPDVLSEDEAFERPFDPEIQAKKTAQDAAYQGKGGALLMVLSAADGETLCQVDLAAPPVWDGMAVADGRLYMAAVDGALVCMAGR
jgi:hypothetical protein